MRRLVKEGLRAAWRWAAPLRRPLVRKVDAYIDRCLEPTGRLLASERLRADEANMVMNHVVRELIQLQRQFETLQESVDDLVSRAEAHANGDDAGRDEARPREKGLTAWRA